MQEFFRPFSMRPAAPRMESAGCGTRFVAWVAASAAALFSGDRTAEAGWTSTDSGWLFSADIRREVSTSESTAALGLLWGVSELKGLDREDAVFDLQLTEADTGRSFSITPADSNIFEHATSLLTNGVSNNVILGISTGEMKGFSGTNEFGFFFRDGTGPVATDLQGLFIKSFNLRLSDVWLNADNPNLFDPYSHGYSGVLTIEATSAVPEPGSLALTTLGGLGLAGGWVRRRRKVVPRHR